MAAPIAAVTTAAAVTLGVVAASAGSGGDVVAAASLTKVAPKPVPTAATLIRDRGTEVSRSLTRRQAVKARTGERLWTTDTLNLWKRPDKRSEQTGELKEGKKVLATGRELDGRVEIVVGDAVRWVTKGYLSEDKPVPAPATPAASAGPAGLSMEPCPDAGVESGLTDSAVRVYRSVCHAFPQITTYGGYDAHGEHSSGKALDIMNSDVELGNAIAEFLRAHAAELNLYDVIWRQHIWTPVRSSEGWRYMPSRGSATANHYDHVHVSTN